ncbi:MAG: ESX secretion-associated protein EspG, partial [Thermocrispum sp.]
EEACAAGALEGVGSFVEVLQSQGIRREESVTLSRALTTRVAGGRLGARASDGSGHWYRAPATVAWLDTEDGRYALRTDGEWITVTPADPVRLLTMAEEMFAAVV